MKKHVVVGILAILFVLILLSGCVEQLDCPCPEQNSDPTGGNVVPLGELQFLNLSYHEFLDLTDIIGNYGQVTESGDRTADLNFTIYNMRDIPVSSTISIRSSIGWQEDSFFLESKICLIDLEKQSTAWLYDYDEWMVGNWCCSTYDYYDYSFVISAYSNRSFCLKYILDIQPSGTFMDGQIYLAKEKCFGLHVSENSELWQYFPFEVRT